jgi:hypothetical protein
VICSLQWTASMDGDESSISHTIVVAAKPTDVQRPAGRRATSGITRTATPGPLERQVIRWPRPPRKRVVSAPRLRARP